MKKHEMDFVGNTRQIFTEKYKKNKKTFEVRKNTSSCSKLRLFFCKKQESNKTVSTVARRWNLLMKMSCRNPQAKAVGTHNKLT